MTKEIKHTFNKTVSDYYWRQRLSDAVAPLPLRLYSPEYTELHRHIHALMIKIKNFLFPPRISSLQLKNVLDLNVASSKEDIDLESFKHLFSVSLPPIQLEQKEKEEDRVQLYPYFDLPHDPVIYQSGSPIAKTICFATCSRLRLPATPLSTQLFRAWCQLSRDPNGLFALYKKANVSALLPIALLPFPCTALTVVSMNAGKSAQRSWKIPFLFKKFLNMPFALFGGQHSTGGSRFYGRIPYKSLAAVSALGAAIALLDDEEESNPSVKPADPTAENPFQEVTKQIIQEIPSARWPKKIVLICALAFTLIGLVVYFLYSRSNITPRIASTPSSPQIEGVATNTTPPRIPSAPTSPRNDGGPARDSIPRIQSRQNSPDPVDPATSNLPPPPPPPASTPQARPSQKKPPSRSVESHYQARPSQKKPPSRSVESHYKDITARFRDLPGIDEKEGYKSAVNLAVMAGDIELYRHICQAMKFFRQTEVGGVMRINAADAKAVIERAKSYQNQSHWH